MKSDRVGLSMSDDSVFRHLIRLLAVWFTAMHFYMTWLLAVTDLHGVLILIVFYCSWLIFILEFAAGRINRFVRNYMETRL